MNTLVATGPEIDQDLLTFLDVMRRLFPFCGLMVNPLKYGAARWSPLHSSRF